MKDLANQYGGFYRDIALLNKSKFLQKFAIFCQKYDIFSVNFRKIAHILTRNSIYSTTPVKDLLSHYREG
jgi:hypothetical protein